MIWGSVGFNFKSKLIIIIIKINAKEYVKILADNQIIESMNERFDEFGYVFQQDGASTHRAKITIEFYEKSRSYFNQIKFFNEINAQCNIENCNKSIGIFVTFSDEFIEKAGIPKIIALPGKTICVPK